MHEVLVNRLGGLSLPRKSVVRLTDRPDMASDVYRDVKQYNNNNLSQIVKQTRWKTLAIFQKLSHVYGLYIADAFIKYRVGRYTHRQKRYKYYISVTKSGVLMELFDLQYRLFCFFFFFFKQNFGHRLLFYLLSL